MAPRKMVLNRNHVLTSLFGHTVRFTKGEPVFVPPVLYSEALAIGAEFEDGEGLKVSEVQTAAEPTDPAVRAERVLSALTAIVERNLTREFTAAGLPKADAMSKQAGFQVSNKEIAAAWAKYHDMRAEAALNGTA